jgi:hypothetical protein
VSPMIALVPTPLAVSRTICARLTCFCDALRSLTRARTSPIGKCDRKGNAGSASARLACRESLRNPKPDSNARFDPLAIEPGSRRFTMSGRSCSVPCAVLVAHDLVAVKEAPQRAIAWPEVLRGQRRPELFERDIRISSAWRSTRIERRSRQNRLRRRATLHPFHPPAAIALEALTPKRIAASRHDRPDKRL